MSNSGNASTTSTAAPEKNAVHGRRCTKRLHRHQNCCSRGFSLRCGSSVRIHRLRPGAKPTPHTTIPSSGPINSSASAPVKMPTSDSVTHVATPSAAAREVFSMERPAKPSNDGSSVMEAIIITSTAMAPATARPRTNARPTTNRPSSETITVMPANTTARPDVSTARTVASSGSRPAWRFSR